MSIVVVIIVVVWTNDNVWPNNANIDQQDVFLFSPTKTLSSFLTVSHSTKLISVTEDMYKYVQRDKNHGT